MDNVYELVFTRDGNYVMQDINKIEDLQYQTITSDNEDYTLPSLIFLFLGVSMFLSLSHNIRPKGYIKSLFLSLTHSLSHTANQTYLNVQMTGTLTTYLFHLYFVG